MTTTPTSGAADLRDTLINIAREIEALKRECGMDPESPIAIQNGRYMALSCKVRALAAGQATAAQQRAAYAELPDAPLSVFSKGPWTFKETGQNFSGAELDEAAFVAYRDRASHGQAPAQPAPAYKDSTPELHIGDSAFESWYSTYSPAHKSDKQRARDAYAAGMGDPLVTAAPAAVAGKPWGACVSGRVFVGGLPDHVRKLAEAENLPIQWLYTTPQPTQPQAEPKSGAAKSFQTYGEANAYSKGYYAGKKAALVSQPAGYALVPVEPSAEMVAVSRRRKSGTALDRDLQSDWGPR